MEKRFQFVGQHLFLPDGVSTYSFTQQDLFSLATFEACDLGHRYVATHHMLLVLEKQSDTVCQGMLKQYGLSRSTILAVINELDPPQAPIVLMGRLGYTDGLVDAVRVAAREAEWLVTRQISVENLLLGIAHTDEGVLWELFARSGLHPIELRQKLLQRLQCGLAQP